MDPSHHHPDFDLDAVLSTSGTEPVGPPARAPVPASAVESPVSRPVRTAPSPKGRFIDASLRTARRHQRPAIAVFLISMAVAAVATFSATPVYETRVRLQFEHQARRILPFRPVTDESRSLFRELRRRDGPVTRGAGGVEEDPVNLIELFSPRELARRTLDDLNLWDEFAPGQPAAADAGDVARDDERRSQAGAVRAVVTAMRISHIRRTRLIDLRFRSADPALAVKVANGLAASLIAVSAESRAERGRAAADWLANQLGDLHQELQHAERALQRYREQHGAVVMRAHSPVMRHLLDLNAAATRARASRIEKEVLHRQVSGADGDLALVDALPGAFNDVGLRRQRLELQALERQEAELSARLGERHPELQSIRRAIDESETRLQARFEAGAAGVRNAYEAALLQERELMAALERQRVEALAVDRAGIQLGLLQADVDAARRIYTEVRRRHDQVRAVAEASTSGMRVVDPAGLPTRPVLPNHWSDLLMGLAIAVVLSSGTVVGLEYWRGIRSPADVQRQTGLGAIGMFPRLPGPSGQRRSLLVTVQASDAFGEAIRALRTNLRFAVPGAAGRVVVVTSTEPGEGKSTVLASLAAAMALDGQRVLIVDADMRRPVIHDLVDVRAEPGLSNALEDPTTQCAVVPTALAQLFVLPAGPVPPNPSELLLSPRYAALLESFREEFDWVFVDAPPVLAVTDPVVLARHASGVLFVVDAKTWSRRRIAFALTQLGQAQGLIVGAVVNRAPLLRET